MSEAMNLLMKYAKAVFGICLVMSGTQAFSKSAGPSVEALLNCRGTQADMQSFFEDANRSSGPYQITSAGYGTADLKLPNKVSVLGYGGDEVSVGAGYIYLFIDENINPINKVAQKNELKKDSIIGITVYTKPNGKYQTLATRSVDMLDPVHGHHVMLGCNYKPLD
ncbi:hypothetical protein [Burkholderia sp. LMG 32019]|uniref:hypothetical protein n=1 Tax=Burkholderia sp. LMG 32019 TaxID=3158173 RepID=UPI003C2CBFA4